MKDKTEKVTGIGGAHRNLACFLSAMAVSKANEGKGFWKEK
jgi:hypothetical protein